MVDTTRIITPEGEFVSRFFNRKIGWANHAFFVTGLLLVFFISPELGRSHLPRSYCSAELSSIT